MANVREAEYIQEPARARMEREARARMDERPQVAREVGAAINTDMRRALMGPTPLEEAEAKYAQARAEADAARARARDAQGRFTGGLDQGQRSPLPGPGDSPNASVNDWLRGGGVGEIGVPA